MEAIQELMRTDLPLPVVPAISTCGILAILATMGLPETSRPKATISLSLPRFIMSLSNFCRIVTYSSEWLGISMPTRLRPGMGASILICPVGADKARAKSLDKAVIFESLVPRVISKAYWVTAGPLFTSVTWALMPKPPNVLSMIPAFCFMSPRSAFCPGADERIDNGGYSQTELWALRLVTRPVPRSPLGNTAAVCLPVLAASFWLISFSIGVGDILGIAGARMGNFSAKISFFR